MKKFITLLSLLVIGTTVSYSQSALPVDTANSNVSWLAKKVTGQHDGHIQIKEGQVTLDENGRLTGGQFTIDMTTISVADIENEKMNAKLVGHLNSPDFFDVENYPIAHFIITSVAYSDEGINVEGNLTIKGKTNPVSFNIDVKESEDADFEASTSFDVDRTLYDVRYGSGKFFDNLGDKTIYDNFVMTIDLLAKK